MAFDKPFEEVFQDMAHIDAKIMKENDREDIVNQREMLQLQGHLAQYNNPLNFLTPILIVTIIIIAILATVCICAMGFCWYVRYNKKQERRDGLGNRRPHPGEHHDPEHNGHNKISMNNVNEESIQFVNNIYKDWKRSESMRSGSRHSRREREESEKSSEVNVPLAGDRFANGKHSPHGGISGGWKSERPDDDNCYGNSNKEDKLGWE